MHVVVDGDTLTRLAARYLGSSDRYQEFFAANRKFKLMQILHHCHPLVALGDAFLLPVFEAVE